MLSWKQFLFATFRLMVTLPLESSFLAILQCLHIFFYKELTTKCEKKSAISAFMCLKKNKVHINEIKYFCNIFFLCKHFNFFKHFIFFFKHTKAEIVDFLSTSYLIAYKKNFLVWYLSCEFISSKSFGPGRHGDFALPFLPVMR